LAESDPEEVADLGGSETGSSLMEDLVSLSTRELSYVSTDPSWESLVKVLDTLSALQKASRTHTSIDQQEILSAAEKLSRSVVNLMETLNPRDYEGYWFEYGDQTWTIKTKAEALVQYFSIARNLQTVYDSFEGCTYQKANQEVRRRMRDSAVEILLESNNAISGFGILIIVLVIEIAEGNNDLRNEIEPILTWLDSAGAHLGPIQQMLYDAILFHLERHKPRPAGSGANTAFVSPTFELNSVRGRRRPIRHSNN
jgi:hypothetical protein